VAPKIEVEISAIDKLSANVANINRNVSGFVNNLQSKFSALTKGFAAIGLATGAIAVVNGIKGMVQAGINYGDTVTDMARRTGLTTDKVQELSYIAKQSGTSVESLSMAFNKIAIGAYNNNKAFGLLNINVKNTDGTLKETGVLFEETLIKLAGITGNTERAAIAQKLFGKGGMEINGIVSEGADCIKELIAQTKEYGLILDGKTINKLHEAKEAQELLKTSTTVLSAELSAQLVPSLTSATLALAKFLSIINDDGKKSRETLIEEYTQQFDALDASIKSAEKSGLGGVFLEGTFRTLSKAKVDLESIRNTIKEINKDPKTSGNTTGGYGGDDKAATEAEKKETAAYIKRLKMAREGDEAMKQAKIERLEWERSIDEKYSWDFEKELKWRRDTQEEVTNEQIKIDQDEYDFQEMLRKNKETNIQKHAERQIELYSSLGSNIGRALGEGIASGDMGKAFRGMTVEMLSFIEDLMLEAIAANTLKNITVSPPGLFWVGALKGAAEAVPIAAIFEGLKASLGNMASGGVSRGGIYRVGEHGPEDAYLPRGTTVYNAMQTRNINNNNSGSTVTVNVLGSNGRVVETLRASLRAGGSGDGLVRDLKEALAVA
jgi:hypothetical protein